MNCIKNLLLCLRDCVTVPHLDGDFPTVSDNHTLHRLTEKKGQYYVNDRKNTTRSVSKENEE